MLKQALTDLLKALTKLVTGLWILLIVFALGFMVCLVLVMGADGGIKKSSVKRAPRIYDVGVLHG